ncbi:LOW QUALITY PROTEIN: cyclin E-interacting protein minus [Aphomia sociella]
MESLEESNCHSMSDSFSLYERYLRSFNVVDNFIEEDRRQEPIELTSTRNCDYDSSNSVGNIHLSVVTPHNVINKHCETAEIECKLFIPTTCNNVVDKSSPLNNDVGTKVESPCTSLAGSFDNSFGTGNCLLNEKSDPIEVLLSSDDSKFEPFKHPVFITSTMENSNNAVDSVPMFCDIRKSESVFKLPISELSFNGTIKHVKKLKPIVDPITALKSNSGLVNLDEKTVENCVEPYPSGSDDTEHGNGRKDISDLKARSLTDSHSSYEKNNMEKTMESSGDSQYEEFSLKKDCHANEEASNTKWNSEQSYSSLEASFDSGVRSPDLFSDEDGEEAPPESEPFWSFLKDFEAHDKKKVKKIEKTLQGVLPPPSVTILKTDVTEMLKKYYCFLPAFTEGSKNHVPEVNSMTPTKGVSYVQIPTETESLQSLHEIMPHAAPKCSISEKSKESTKSDTDLDVSVNDKSIDIKLCTQIEAAETSWPELLKCKYYDVYYNVTTYSEKFELLALRYGERYVGAETDTSVNIYSGGLQSPSSASKRKALRLKMAQAKSPGRRLSHLARRRQAFCSAATINEKAQASQSRMVLIDKNFFPHRKLINTSERRSPRFKRTPGKNTSIRKTPGKKTPAKTPDAQRGSSRKKAMRRLLMDPENITRSQPSRETLKRALFISPENRKTIPSAPSSSVPLQAMRSKRALFGSPELAQTKSSDGSLSDQFLKRKRDAFDEDPDNRRSKIAKSLSFGGDTIGNTQLHSFARRASEVFVSNTAGTAQLNGTHKKKLLWAVSEALRPHGWSMSSPGFRDKASALARLTRKMLTLAPHAARLASPHLSTSETMLKLARQYAFPIIQGRSVDDCFEEEQVKVNNEANSKVTGYISASAYQQLKARQASTSTFTSKIKENTCDASSQKQEQPKSSSKNILQDKLVNIDANSSSSSGLSMIEKPSLGMFKSNSMPSFEEAAKMRARRQISFDNIDFPKR